MWGASRTQQLVERPFPASHEVSLAEARRFLPDRVGIVLAKDVTKHMRWHATFPRAGTHVVTKTFGGRTALTERVALIQVLRQVWSWEEEAGGQPCPHTFVE